MLQDSTGGQATDRWNRWSVTHLAGGGLDARQPLGAGPAHLGGPAELLEQPDRPRGDVQLAAEHAVPGAGWVGMVQVVPGLTERQQGERPEVRRLVAGRERALTDHVADRVHRPGDVVQQRDPDQAGPEEG